MDLQLALWVLVFVGGYVAALGFLLRTAIWKKDGRGGDPTG